MTNEEKHTPPPVTHVGGPDWLKVAKLAGEHGVRYQTNARMKRFLAALGVNVEGLE